MAAGPDPMRTPTVYPDTEKSKNKSLQLAATTEFELLSPLKHHKGLDRMGQTELMDEYW